MSKKRKLPQPEKTKFETGDIEHALHMAQQEVSERIEALHEELEELENKFQCYEEALIQLGVIIDTEV